MNAPSRNTTRRATAPPRRTPRAGEVVVCALLVCALLGVASQSLARPQHRTLFADLHDAEQRVTVATGEMRGDRHQLDANAARLKRALETLALTDRATHRLHTDSVRRHASWARAAALRDRNGAALPPGEADDTHALLKLAEPRVLITRRQDHDILTTLDYNKRRVIDLVRTRAQAHVRLAQDTGERDKAAEDVRNAHRRARRATRARINADLAATNHKLKNSLGVTLKNPSREDFHRRMGALVTPVRQKPTHGYGPRKQADSLSFTRHTGLTYVIPTGTRVRAIGAGLVVYANHFEGYGQLVIIDHGSGYHSVYAHLSKITARIGQKLGRGDGLGESGDTGSLEGPKLYFELRKNGLPINPTRWFISVLRKP